MKTYNINDFGAVADGGILCTKAVQKAVDVCNVNGVGIVRFGKGTYVLSSVFLKSNVTVEIPEGTEILGAESFDDTKSGNTKESDWQMTSNICGLVRELA